jgi:hypothetical protein
MQKSIGQSYIISCFYEENKIGMKCFGGGRDLLFLEKMAIN